MSDIGIDFPFPVVLVLVGALYWPVTLTMALGLAALGFILPRRWARVGCLIAGAILAVECLLALWLPGD